MLCWHWMAVFYNLSPVLKKTPVKSTPTPPKKKHFSVQLLFTSVHPSIHTGPHTLMQPLRTYKKLGTASDSTIMNWASSLVFSFPSDPEPAVQNRGILCSCWEEMASIHRSCCPSQTSASPSPAPVSVGWLRLLIPVTGHLCTSADSDCFLSFLLSSHEDWLWKHGGEDGVQREVCQQGVFQLQATGPPGAADHQTKQCRRFLL